jgi:methyl-accepting chemotaxis protein
LNFVSVGAISSEVAEGINRLREAVVHTVRTSTEEVDHRCSPRIQIDHPGTVSAAGKNYTVTIKNISEGGALMSGLPSELAVGTRIELSVPGNSLPLTGKVLAANGGQLRAEFSPTQEIAERWHDECARLNTSMTSIQHGPSAATA